MFTVEYMLIIMVMVGFVLGVADIIRDLWLDRQPYHDWHTSESWERAPVSPNMRAIDWFFMDPKLPHDMLFDSIEVDDPEFKGMLCLGFNVEQMKKLLDEADELSDEDSIEPIFIDVTSTIHDELRNEYRAQSYQWRSGSQEGYVDVM